MDILIPTQWATIITVRLIIPSIYFAHGTFQVMSTTVDTEDTMVVVGTVDITAVVVGTIMRVMEVIIMGVTEVMEEEDMVDIMEVAVDMVDTMAVEEDMEDTMEAAVATADTTEGTDTILVVLVLAMVIDTDSPLSFRY